LGEGWEGGKIDERRMKYSKEFTFFNHEQKD
jgi:hypothetical protein